MTHDINQMRLERLRETIKYAGGEAGAFTTLTRDYNFSVNNNNDGDF
jgi:hypothetical protein